MEQFYACRAVYLLCMEGLCLLYLDGVPVKKHKSENKDNILEMLENAENPLRCPVRLYEFYLSKWLVNFNLF